MKCIMQHMAPLSDRIKLTRPTTPSLCPETGKTGVLQPRSKSTEEDNDEYKYRK